MFSGGGDGYLINICFTGLIASIYFSIASVADDMICLSDSCLSALRTGLKSLGHK